MKMKEATDVSPKRSFNQSMVLENYNTYEEGSQNSWDKITEYNTLVGQLLLKKEIKEKKNKMENVKKMLDEQLIKKVKSIKIQASKIKLKDKKHIETILKEVRKEQLKENSKIKNKVKKEKELREKQLAYFRMKKEIDDIKKRKEEFLQLKVIEKEEEFEEKLEIKKNMEKTKSIKE
mmetsp:Transcript_27476/g.24356  ORF Transcript_27476/g.24356 Transcript_27476/m.24356 type:complete len:177 (+) Transcript_27476:499-1029(+)